VNYKHGCSRKAGKTPEFVSWISMRDRCSRRTHSEYKNYGGRGITICERWNDFTLFLSDMGTRPDGMSLDRINVNGNYEPANCRWATRKEQARNATSSVFLEHNGQKKTMAEWGEVTGIGADVIQERVTRYKWGVARALTTPKRILPPRKKEAA